MDIIEMYYQSTPNAENKDQILVPQAKSDEVQDVPERKQPLVDASILTHVMELLNTLLKRTKDKSSPEFSKIMDLFPRLL
jgi:restriction endonuclease Mrr